MGHVWAYDFLFDRCANAQQLKCLTVVDEFTHECLAIDVAGSIRSGRVIEVLSRLVSVHGSPKYLRSDNGLEFVSRTVLKWLTGLNIDTAHIDPVQRDPTTLESRAANSGRVQTAIIINQLSGTGHFLSHQWTEECRQVTPMPNS